MPEECDVRDGKKTLDFPADVLGSSIRKGILTSPEHKTITLRLTIITLFQLFLEP